TDSQAAIKALQSNKITSKLVLDCHKLTGHCRLKRHLSPMEVE
ncbi:uncharacterized protein LOC132704140, partial [Cylas formicarius]